MVDGDVCDFGQRKKTLLQEYKQSGKANVFLDRRFGENDDTLEDADKAIIRFQRERQVMVHYYFLFGIYELPIP
jgi:hypothetical protein